MPEQIIEQLKALQSVSNLLEVPEDKRTEWTAMAAAYTNKFIESLGEAKSFTDKNPTSLAIDDKTYSFPDLLKQYQENVAETGILAASGGHLGYIPTGGIFTSALADYIAAVTNPYAGTFYASPGAATIERECINWLKKIFSFPENAVGDLTSGGSISTLIALTAARDHHGIKNEKVKNSVVYLSEQVHHSSLKALRIIGLEDVIVRKVPLDKHFRMNTAMLHQLIEEDKTNGLNPFLVIASAGTTDTGAVDPLDTLADIAHAHGLWYHVDAAYGGFFILSSKKDLFKGIEKADSLIVDPHKGMFIPYGLGAILIKNYEAALHSHYYTANYMQDGYTEDLIKSSANLSPELSRHFRGLRMWLPLKIHGIEPFIANWEEKILLLQYFRKKMAAMGFELGEEPDLTVSYFRYPFAENVEEKNKQLMEAIHHDGRTFLSSSVIGGHFVIRIAILSFRTKKETIDKTIDMIASCLDKIKQG